MYMGRISYRPKKNQGKQDTKKQGIVKEKVQQKASIQSEANNEPEQTDERIQVTTNKQNTGKLESIKVVGDMECDYHIYVEDYVYTYIYQLAAADLSKESSAILIGEIYSDSKEAVIRGIIPVNMDKLKDGAEWIDMGVVEEIESQRKTYFKDQDIIGWMHMQPGYGTMLTMKELREHQSVFEGNGTICMLVDAINKIETLYVYEDDELKEQSGYCMYYERNEQMQQYMLDNPFTTSSKEEMKDTVVNQFREIGKMRKAEYNQRKNLNFTVITASIILIALTIVIVRMNDSKEYSQVAQLTNGTPAVESSQLQENQDALGILSEEMNNTDAVGTEESIAPEEQSESAASEEQNTEEITSPSAEVNTQLQSETPAAESTSEGQAAEEESSTEAGQASESSYDTYIVKSGDTLADICYKEYGNAKRSLEVAKYNGLSDTNQIYVGQELKMPK